MRAYLLERIAYALLGAHGSLAIVLWRLGETESALIALASAVLAFVATLAFAFHRRTVGHESDAYIERRPWIVRPSRPVKIKR